MARGGSLSPKRRREKGRMKTGTGGACLLCSVACILSACGSAASFDYELPAGRDDNGAPQATMSGITMGEDTGANPDLLRFALEWFPASPAGKRQMKQHVNFRLGWENHFRIDIVEDPPVPAIEGVGTMQYGQAEIILYEDGNRNEELDLVPRDLVSPDRIIGRAQGVRVWWLGAGSPASPDDRGYKPIAKGWSFTYGPIDAKPEAVDCSPGQQMGETWKPLCPPSRIKEAKDVTPEELFIVTTSRDPKLQSYACLGGARAGQIGPVVRQDRQLTHPRFAPRFATRRLATTRRRAS